MYGFWVYDLGAWPAGTGYTRDVGFLEGFGVYGFGL